MGVGWLLILLFLTRGPLRAETTTVRTDPPPAASELAEDEDETKTEDIGESSTGIIPRNGGVYVSSQPVTPITEFPDRSAYEQSLEELAQAKVLLSKLELEAASDMALQAYDDLCSLHMPRGKRNKKKRAKLRAERYDAARVYIDASIPFIQSYVKQRGDSPAARQEGRNRLDDLRDVAREYSDLNNKLNQAFDRLK